MLQNILNLEGVTVLNKKQQNSVNGGKSKLYCWAHSTTVKVFGVVIHDGHVDYEECRKMK
mgnify:CR=1 FL=1|tara:strand:- start:397 stop:576 length:180 start_codon:yes stop_codon:yes gene_type:complete